MNTLFVAWRSGDKHQGVWGPVGMLNFDGKLYRFCYTLGALKFSGFQPFPSMEDLHGVYASAELFPLFANRLLSQTRPEYEDYLRWGGFNPGYLPDPVAILSITGGISQTDSIEVFPCPIPDQTGCFQNKFFLHGIRWLPQESVNRIVRLQPEEQLLLMPDPANQYDPYAVAVRTQIELMVIGYVPRYLNRDILHLLQDCDPENIDLVVDRLNSDAPLQQRVLCKMRSCWPDDFRPCQSEEFRPIPAEMAGLCSEWIQGAK
jgi:hypothetical protein